MRLGLEWHNAQSCHSMIDDSLHPIGSQPFLTVDGDHVGLHTTQRFVEEIRALGCSNSSSDLGRIAELLDEHEGEDIPLCTQHMGSWDNQFAWMPQRSPIEFSHCLSAPGHNTRIPWDPASLGLVCARLDCQGKPMADEHTLHLLQLGYLCMRPASDIEQSEWTSSGHIVAWDRVNGGFVAIFVGKGHGVISSGYLPSSLPSPSRPRITVYPIKGSIKDYRRGATKVEVVDIRLAATRVTKQGVRGSPSKATECTKEYDLDIDLRNAPRPELQLDITYLRHLTICSRDTSTVNHLHHYLTLCGITAQKHIHTTI
ncbi:hypothetical protein DTO195F2_2341 [Paecilomyces variotii]|nr:hypothetical protein DTO195F2_2341 [Paecilomyces variotii]KAJ9366869.1 hypothetical protein DTO282E5_8425 [Paecilomyces variotii]